MVKSFFSGRHSYALVLINSTKVFPKPYLSLFILFLAFCPFSAFVPGSPTNKLHTISWSIATYWGKRCGYADVSSSCLNKSLFSYQLKDVNRKIFRDNKIYRFMALNEKNERTDGTAKPILSEHNQVAAKSPRVSLEELKRSFREHQMKVDQITQESIRRCLSPHTIRSKLLHEYVQRILQDQRASWSPLRKLKQPMHPA